MRSLQEALADHNTVLDKSGSQTPIDHIRYEHQQLKEVNDGTRRRVEAIVTERLAVERKAKQAEARIAEVQRSLDAQLGSLPPSQRQQYGELVAEQAMLSTEAKKCEEAMDELDKQLGAAEGELARNPVKHRSLQLAESIRLLKEKLFEAAQVGDPWQ